MTTPNDSTLSPASTPTRTAPTAAGIPAGHRIANHDETGWAWAYVDDDGERRSIWITDAPAALVSASTPTRAPRPTLAPLPPSADFLATLQTPSKPWLTDLSEADLKSYIRSACQRRDIRMANVYAAELARRNTLCQLEREHGYAALASALVGARKGRVAA